MEAVELYESLSFTLVRQHRLLGSEAFIWQRLTALTAVNYPFPQVFKPCSSADFSSHGNTIYGAHTVSFLITANVSAESYQDLTNGA